MRRVQQFIGEGYRIAVDLDLAKFFDNVQHDVLMARVARKVRDKRLLALIGKYLRAGVLVGEQIEATEIGSRKADRSRRCSPISCWTIGRQGTGTTGRRLVRYADDLLILVKSRRAGERVMASVIGTTGAFTPFSETLPLVINYLRYALDQNPGNIRLNR